MWIFEEKSGAGSVGQVRRRRRRRWSEAQKRQIVAETEEPGSRCRWWRSATTSTMLIGGEHPVRAALHLA